MTIRRLVRNALRMRPDRLVVGEVRGPEALDLLVAMGTGHAGSLCTIHAGSAAEALRRLETLALMADVGLPLAAIREQVAEAIDLVVRQERGADGVRRVVEVAEVVRVAGGPAVRELFAHPRRPPVLARAARRLARGRGRGRGRSPRQPPPRRRSPRSRLGGPAVSAGTDAAAGGPRRAGRRRRGRLAADAASSPPRTRATSAAADATAFLPPQGGAVSAAAWLAAGAAGAGVVGAWEALAAVERTRLAAAAGRVLEPLARAGREGREPTAPERRRLGAVAAACLLAAGWLLGGPCARRARGALPDPPRSSLVVRARAAALARGAAAGRARVRADDGRRARRRPLDPHGGRRRGGAPPRARPRMSSAPRRGRSSSARRPMPRCSRVRARARSHAWDTLVAAVLLQRDAGGDLAGAAPRAGRIGGGRRARRARRPRRDGPGPLHGLARARDAARGRGRRRARRARLRGVADREPAVGVARRAALLLALAALAAIARLGVAR